MSRSATRARRRRARLKEEIEALVARAKSTRRALERSAIMGELLELLKCIADSELRIWSFEDQLRGLDEMVFHDQEEAEATNALIAQLVAGRLAGGTPISIYRRRDLKV